MSFICAISGEAPATPVISAKTGRVYEQRLLQKYLDEEGREPGTEHSLSEDEIISVHADPPAVKPRPPTLTSIPALLSTFQNEWDALVLETFTLKQQYQQVRQELSQALYQNDASCRVIARLIKERDEARQTLESLQAQVGELRTQQAVDADDAAGASMEVDAGNPEEVYYEKSAEVATELRKGRVKRKLPADLTPADQWKAAALASTVESLHSTTQPGILALDVDTTGELVLTAGEDHHAEVYARSKDQTLATLKGHTKRVNAALWINGGGLGERIITASADKSVRIWQPKANNTHENAKAIGWTKKHVIKTHAAEVTSLSIHPGGEYFASASIDGTWAIHTIDGDTVITEQLDSQITQIEFHPDGQFIGIGTADGLVKIVDVKQKQTLATLDVATEAEAKQVVGLHFSENGYYFATTSAMSAAVWDLRKQRKVREWSSSDLESDDAAAFTAIRFDKTGGYLAFANDKLHIFQVKGWHHLCALGDSSAITSVAWIGSLSTGIVAASSDNSLRVFEPKLLE
ncbi:putative nuclear matrix protein NMP200 [Linderina pennispora]|uniref:Pre-mRNA-processing factor 19 n=1 Tax=Linderina pennispora TaxID=61395 RepID=A0A1Y1VXL6_9FUNG|nr:putative nuclear matrix protein NMP200 [Linderina pennispora]ORX65756.1 putative nuclear matrix protein NMP200 [Linderina pennispora]